MPKKPTSPAKINPPEGWKDGEGYVRMYGHDAQGQPVYLVRLADLAQWLELRDLLPAGGGAQAIDRALPGDSLAWVYWLANKNASGVPVPSTCAFGQYTSEKGANAALQNVSGRRVYSRGIGAPASAYASSKRELIPAQAQRFAVVEPGMPALHALLAQIAGQDAYVLSQVGNVWESLAIPMTKAHALWGWGRVDSVGEAVEIAGSELAKAIAYDWTNPKTKAALLRDFEVAPGASMRKKSEYLATTEKWSGVSAETLRKKAAALKPGGKTSLAGKKEAATPWDGLGGSTQRKGGRTG